MTKREYSNALADRRIVIVGQKFTRNGWTEFMVFEVPKKANKDHYPLESVVVKDCPYWSDTAQTYKCTAWGTSRTLEIILGIGYALGCTFNEMQQKYQTLN